jgi:hypothetical protein
MEPKYVSLTDVVKAYQDKQGIDPKVGLFNHLEFVFPEMTPGCFAEPVFEPIFTEDIDYELVEPKQLPPSAP